jgi:hypothetical protein
LSILYKNAIISECAFKISGHDFSSPTDPIGLKIGPVSLRYIRIHFSEADFLYFVILSRYKAQNEPKGKPKKQKKNKIAIKNENLILKENPFGE